MRATTCSGRSTTSSYVKRMHAPGLELKTCVTLGVGLALTPGRMCAVTVDLDDETLLVPEAVDSDAADPTARPARHLRAGRRQSGVVEQTEDGRLQPAVAPLALVAATDELVDAPNAGSALLAQLGQPPGQVWQVDLAAAAGAVECFLQLRLRQPRRAVEQSAGRGRDMQRVVLGDVDGQQITDVMDASMDRARATATRHSHLDRCRRDAVEAPDACCSQVAHDCTWPGVPKCSENALLPRRRPSRVAQCLRAQRRELALLDPGAELCHGQTHGPQLVA